MTFAIPASRTWRDGQMIHEKITVSSSWHFTAIGNDVSLPSGHIVAPAFDDLQRPVLLEHDCAVFGMLSVDFSRLAVGTAATNPST
jgi:hypothetical protein